MLAYLFWHYAKRATDPAAYEANLKQFHAALASDPPQGFVSSLTFRIGEVPWLRGADPTYEDWYLVEDSSALDPLNAFAVSGPRSEPHAWLAAAADAGTGGLYRLRAGAPASAGGFAHWFAKPGGMSYAELDHVLSSLLGADGALWSRQMTLGPAREFCLTANSSLTFPSPFAPLIIRRSPI